MGQVMNALFVKMRWRTGTEIECIMIYLFGLIALIFIGKIPLRWCKKIVI